jgi:hypothetical protein
MSPPPGISPLAQQTCHRLVSHSKPPGIAFAMRARDSLDIIMVSARRGLTRGQRPYAEYRNHERVRVDH